MNMLTRTLSGVVVLSFVGAAILSVVVTAKGAATPWPTQCYDVEFMYARGSGEDLDAPMKRAAESEISKKFANSGITTNVYEIGPQSVYGHQYTPIAVNNTAGVMAYLTSGADRYRYGDSIEKGRQNVLSYLDTRHRNCRDMRLVLIGYSQGAQVIGEAIRDESDNEVLSHIDFVGLFGDPKLNLPEGARPYGILNPPACDGRDLSVWRRDTPSCTTHQGILYGRAPYFSGEIASKIGSWCGADDSICDHDIAPWSSGHYQYANRKTNISDAIGEAAKRIRPQIPEHKINSVLNPETKRRDIIIVIGPQDCTKDNVLDLNEIVDDRATVASLYQQTVRENTRYKVISFTDYSQLAYTTPFTHELSELSRHLGTYREPTFCHSPDDTSWFKFATLAWPDDSEERQLIYVDPVPGRFEQAKQWWPAQAPLTSPRMPIMRFQPGQKCWYVGDTLKCIVSEMPVLSLDVTQSSEDIIVANADRSLYNVPLAILPLPNYDIKVGGSIHFDASKSEVSGTHIVSYLWDFDGNGVFDQTTSGPIIDHVYTALFEGKMILRVQSSNGLYADASVPVRVSDNPYGGIRPGAPKGVKATVISTTSVRIDWSASDNTPISAWQVALDGFPLGYTKPDQPYIILTDLRPNTQAEVTVLARNIAHFAGNATSHAFTLSVPAVKSAPVANLADISVSAAQSPRRAAVYEDSFVVPTLAATSLAPRQQPVVATNQLLSNATALIISGGIVGSLVGFIVYKLFRLTKRQ